MNELKVIDNEKIEKMIFEVRGKFVMLDSDIANLYHVETKRVNEAVKNNLEKFPERYSFILTKEEYIDLRSKISTSSLETGYGGRRYLPRVFTEEGSLMLSTVLKSKEAIRTSIAITDAFVSMKKYISNNLLEQRFINNLVLEHDNDIKLLKESFSKFDSMSNEIFYEGQIYDAYSLLLDILKENK